MLKRKRDQSDATKAAGSTWTARFPYKPDASFSKTYLKLRQQQRLMVTVDKAREKTHAISTDEHTPRNKLTTLEKPNRDDADRVAKRQRLESLLISKKQQAVRTGCSPTLLGLPLELRQNIFSYLLEGLHLHFCGSYHRNEKSPAILPVRVFNFTHAHPQITNSKHRVHGRLDPCANPYLRCHQCSLSRGHSNTYCHKDTYDFVWPQAICRQLRQEFQKSWGDLMDSNVVSFDSMSESGHGDWILPSADCCSRVTMLWLGEKSAPGPFYKAEHVKGAFRKLKQLHMRDYFVGDDLDDPDVAEYWDRKRRITREWAQHNLEVGYHMGQ